MHQALPPYRFSQVPPLKQAIVVARAVRRRWGLTTGERVDVAARLAALGWIVQLRDLEAPSGGLEAAMAPGVQGFVFVADTRPSPARPKSGRTGESASRDDLVNLRLAHELGHVFFYDRTAAPRRLSPQSREEEDFCDTFAEALVARTS